jgi:integrase
MDVLDAAGRPRSPATLPGYHRRRPPRNKGVRYPADPPTVEEIVAVMRAAGNDVSGLRLRALVVVMWRAGLRISEALALAETDLDSGRGAALVRCGKGGKRREVGMDDWAWDQLSPWLETRRGMPIGALFCVLRGPTRGRPWSASGVRSQLRRAAGYAGVRRPVRAAPTPTCTRGRDGAGGRAVARHPAPARPRQPGHHFDLPTGHRQR